MAFWDFLFDKSINDEMFGRIASDEAASTRFWHGRVRFVPIDGEIDFYFFDLEKEVSAEQKQFYKELEKRYPEINRDVAGAFRNRVLRGDYSLEKDFGKFKLISISFPSTEELKKASFIWGLDYATDAETSTFAVEMKNWKPDEEECFFGEEEPS